MGKKVSIIIPVYNGSNYVGEAIESAIAQTYPDKEIIVVNDGSTDDGATKNVVEKYLDQVTYYEKENGGVSTALNYGIEKMTGDYFSWLSHDDKYYPDKLEKQMKEIEKYDDNTILYSDIDFIDLEGNIINTVRYDHEYLQAKPDYAVLRGNISGISLLIPKKAFDECGLFDVKLRCVQDYLKWFEFMEKYKFVHMPEVLASSRVHPQQVTLTSPKMLSEGNWIWTYITEDYDKEKMVEYEGSEYVFYKEMENYLKSTPYKEAVKNVHQMAENCIDVVKDHPSLTIIVLDNEDKEKVEKTKNSLLRQTYKEFTVIEKDKIGDVSDIKTDYYTYLNAGVEPKSDWLEQVLKIASIAGKGLIVTDYKRPIRTGVSNNYCALITPIDGVLLSTKYSAEYSNSYQYMLDIALQGGSYVTEDKFLENTPEEYNMEEIFDYQRRVLTANKSTKYQLSTLSYDISVIYNHFNTEGKKVHMYEDCDEFREIKFSRSFQMYYKYYNYKKKKKKTI